MTSGPGLKICFNKTITRHVKVAETSCDFGYDIYYLPTLGWSQMDTKLIRNPFRVWREKSRNYKVKWIEVNCETEEKDERTDARKDMRGRCYKTFAAVITAKDKNNFGADCEVWHLILCSLDTFARNNPADLPNLRLDIDNLL